MQKSILRMEKLRVKQKNKILFQTEAPICEALTHFFVTERKTKNNWVSYSL
jgi:hypothetical protein